MAVVIAIVICALVNRLRGGGFFADRLPGRALYACALIVGIIGAMFHGPYGLLWGVLYLVWGAPAWGYLQLLGTPVDGKEPSKLEAVLLRWTGGHVHLAFFLRHLLAGPLAPGIWAAYAAAWRLFPRNPIFVAELATGALWGLLIAL